MARLDTVPVATRVFQNTSNAAIAAPGTYRNTVFFDADGTLKKKDASGAVTTLSGSGITNVDDVVDPASKLSFASNFAVSDQGSGEALVDIFLPSGVSLSTGTAFPGGPSTGDRYRRSDLDYLIFFYDGTRWVTEQIYYATMSADINVSVTTVIGRVPADNPNFSDLWLIDFHITYNIGATNNGSNYWDFTLRKMNSAVSATTLATISSSADSTSTAYTKSAAINALLGSYVWLDTTLFRIGSASAVNAGGAVSYRGVAT